MDKIEELIKLRNQKIFETTKKNIEANPIIIVGGLHVGDLVSRFKSANIKFTIITPAGYNVDDENLIGKLRKSLH